MKKLLKLFALIAASSCAAVTPAFAQSARQMTRSSLPGDSSLLVTSDTTATPGVFATRAISYAAFRTALGVTVRVTDTVRNVTFDSVRAVSFKAGSASACNAGTGSPQYTFSGFGSTGLRCNSGQIHLDASGTNVLTGTTASITSRLVHYFQNGTAAAPSIALVNSATTGFYRLGADTLAAATAGSARTMWNATGFMPTTASYDLGGIAASNQWQNVWAGTSVLAGNGALTFPSFRFINDTDVGMYRVGADTIGFVSAGRLAAAVRDSQVISQTGRVGQPSFSFIGDNNTGIYNSAADGIGVAAGGTSVLTLGTTGAVFPVNAYTLTMGTGTAAAPSITLGNGGGGGPRGFYSVGNDTVGVAIGGVRSTSFAGGANATILGGAGNMTIQAGTGNSRSISLLATNSAGGTVPGFAFFGDSSLNLAASSITITPNGGGSNIPLLRGNAGLVLLGGAGNSRTVVIQTTNGSGTAQTNATFAADQTTTFNSTVQVGGSGQFRSPNGSAATPGHAFANATGSGMYVETTANPDTLGFTSQGSAFLKGISDTLVVWNEAKAPSLTAASGTPNTLCLDATSKLVLENAATSCVVSSRRFKSDIRPLSYSQASYITRNLQPSTFTYRQGGRKAIGLIAEQADSVDSRLATRDSQGRINSVNYEQVTVVLLRQVQELQARLDRMCKAGVTSAC